MGATIGADATPALSFEARAMQIRETEIVADRSGALYVPAEQSLVVADLHLEKGSAFAVRGALLPPYDTRETLRRLAGVIDRYRPRTVVALGDSFHDRRAEARLSQCDLSALAGLQSDRDWIWITGNHDPEISPSVGGDVRTALDLAGLVLRHEPASGPVNGEIAGHLHPAARVLLNGMRLRRPCFVASSNRLVLPSFGAFTGGLNVLDEAFAPLFPAGTFGVHLLGSTGVYPVAGSRLCPD